ncbi:hypothetical protein GCM10010294_01950 [Streptomyces griseoloalbus]|nr:hypothetical protein GCM10010294_01950 [Streptomyces griseoloalbus]
MTTHRRRGSGRNKAIGGVVAVADGGAFLFTRTAQAAGVAAAYTMAGRSRVSPSGITGRVPGRSPTRPRHPRAHWQARARERGAALVWGAAPRPPSPGAGVGQMCSGSGSAPDFAARAYHRALDFGVRCWVT